jgi:hypothetical protein
MLKNKERRDTFLLVTMGIIFILFLVYLFVPLGKKSPEPVETGTKPPENKKKKPVNMSDTHQITGGVFAVFNERIETELEDILDFLKQSPRPFQNYPVDGLRSVLFPAEDQTDTDQDLLPLFEVILKVQRINFYDLKDIFEFDFPDGVDQILIFNLYTGLFMLKIREEKLIREIIEFPDTMFKRIVNCGPYLQINNEIEKDFQSLPILFYFYMLLQRLDIFPTTDVAAFLKERIGDIRDLSPGKLIDQIGSYLGFSRDPQTYRISWTEKDDLSPDDHGNYVNLKINTYVFLNQKYLVFPDFHNAKNNKWIRDLKKSDSGDIELIDFQLSDEDPVKNIQIQTIYYAPGKSQFIILLDRHDFTDQSGFLGRLIHQRLLEVQQYFLSVDFTSRFNDPGSFKTELLNFGCFLKKQVPVK